MANGYLHQNGTKFYPAPFYPIGSVYISVENVNPQNYFGGTWTQISDGYYLMACTSGAKDTGGSGTSGSTKLSASQSGLPAHTHALDPNKRPMLDTGNTGMWGCTINQVSSYNYTAENLVLSVVKNTAQSASEGHTHSITPKYFKVYAWYRIA